MHAIRSRDDTCNYCVTYTYCMYVYIYIHTISHRGRYGQAEMIHIQPYKKETRHKLIRRIPLLSLARPAAVRRSWCQRSPVSRPALSNQSATKHGSMVGGEEPPSSTSTQMCHQQVIQKEMTLQRGAPERRSREALQRGSREAPERRSREALQRGSRDAPERLQRRSREAPERRSREATERRSREAPERLQRDAPETLQRRSREALQRRSRETLQRGAPETLQRGAPERRSRGAPERRSRETLQRRYREALQRDAPETLQRRYREMLSPPQVSTWIISLVLLEDKSLAIKRCVVRSLFNGLFVSFNIF